MSIINAATIVSDTKKVHKKAAPVIPRRTKMQTLREEIAYVVHLPFWHRVANRKALKVLIVTPSSLIMCCLCSYAAINGHHQNILPVYVWDGIAYLGHGCFSVPFIRHAEFFWSVLLG